jgi:serine protease SohB
VVDACKEKTVLAVHYVEKKKLAEKFSQASAEAADRTLLKLIERGQKPVV